MTGVLRRVRYIGVELEHRVTTSRANKHAPVDIVLCFSTRRDAVLSGSCFGSHWPSNIGAAPFIFNPDESPKGERLAGPSVATAAFVRTEEASAPDRRT
jgi:hypothetical protein